MQKKSTFCRFIFFAILFLSTILTFLSWTATWHNPTIDGNTPDWSSNENMGTAIYFTWSGLT